MKRTSRLWTKGVLAFWSWNDKLDRTEIKRQIREFKKAGMSGFFIHARGGLQTPYMGEEWMDAVEAAIGEAKQTDLEVWLYDEDAWPSGFCGGAVPSAGVAHQQKWLAWERTTEWPVPRGERTIAVFERSGEEYKRLSLEAQSPVQAARVPAGECRTGDYLHVYYEVNPYYSDLLNPDTVRLFMEQTHEKYKERFGADFGTTIRGIFTDEPQYAIQQFPWTASLPEHFRSSCGYELLDSLPSLLLDGAPAVRHDYWKLISRCMVDAYMKQIGLWCEDNQLALTGHVAAEDTLFYQMKSTAGAMPFYEWMHIPGIDHLGRRITRPVLLKQVASAAAQLGRDQVLSEMFGCSGWTVGFAELKRIAEWQLSLGVNVQCQHLAAYSLRGARKRDYPPALSYQQPWWPFYDQFNLYFEKLYRWSSQGKRIPRVLLLHPLSSAWCAYDPQNPEELWEMDRRFGDITELLLEMGIDFDYADETLLERHGSVDGDVLHVGEMSYSTLLMPSVLSIERATFDILKLFASAGGTLLHFGTAPQYVEGRQDPELEGWWRQHVKRMMPTVKTVSAALARHVDIQIRDSAGSLITDVYCRVRSLEGQRRYFISNHSAGLCKEGAVRLPGLWALKERDIIRDEETELAYWHAGGDTYAAVRLEGGQSLCLEARQLAVEEAAPDRPYGGAAVFGQRMQRMPDQWEVIPGVTNILTLDRAHYRLEGAAEGGNSGLLPLMTIQDRLGELGADTMVEIIFPFYIEEGLKVDGIEVALEDWEQIELSVNGMPAACERPLSWLDPCMSRIPIGSKLRCGANEIRIRRMFRKPQAAAYLEDKSAFETERNRYVPVTDLESVYLLGSFAVLPEPGSRPEKFPGMHRLDTSGFRLAPLPESVSLRDLTPQGFWFFSGPVTLKQQFRLEQSGGGRLMFRLQRPPAAAVVSVYVNGRHAGDMAWAPYEMDLSPFVSSGMNTIELTLTSGLRNTLGPHHYYMGEVGFVGPSQFKGIKGWEDLVLAYDTPDHTWHDGYHAVEFGLLEAPVLLEYESGHSFSGRLAMESNPGNPHLVPATAAAEK